MMINRRVIQYFLVLITTAVLVWILCYPTHLSSKVGRLIYNLQSVDATHRYDHTSREKEMNRRKDVVREMCKSLKVFLPNGTDSRKRFLIYPPGNFTYCYVAKAGCTKWKRIFLSLQRSEKFLRMLKSKIHGMRISSLKSLSFDKAYEFLRNARKFVFVREPYSRLYSAYLDKFVLGDFWFSFGKMIIKQFRMNPSNFSLECGHDVTFVEFLQHVALASETTNVVGGEEHWAPASKLCNPCSVNFDYIGKQETFVEDMDFISTKLDISNSHWQSRDRSFQINSFSSMAQSTVSAWAKTVRMKGKCQNFTLLQASLLHGFANQGYILDDSNMTSLFRNNARSDIFLQFLRQKFQNQSLDSKEYHNRRRRAMIAAYRTVPINLLLKIREIFKLDFLLFEYESLPDELFRR